MFGLGSGELFVVVALAVLLIAPKDLPKFAKQLGRYYRSFKTALNEVKTSFEEEIRPSKDSPSSDKFLDS